MAVVAIDKSNSDSQQFLFAFTAEKISTTASYGCIGTIIQSTCVSNTVCTDMGTSGSHQEYFLISVDTNGTYAYGFTS